MASPTHPPPEKDQRTKGTVAYILTWLTGLIVFLVADKTDRYSRWHALQAIGLGVALWIASIVSGILDGILFASFYLWGSGGFSPVPFVGSGPLSSLVGLAGLILIILLAVKTYQGETVRLPVIADIADDHA